MAQFADERSGAIKMRLEENELKISSSVDGVGRVAKTRSRRRTPAIRSWSGSIRQYLIDFLKAVGNEGEVRLEFKDAQSAGQMRPEDASDDFKYRYIIMPMRI